MGLPSVTAIWGDGNRYLNEVAEGFSGSGAQHAVRRLSPLPVPGRSDDHLEKKGSRPAAQEDGSFLGVCIIVPEANFGAPEPCLANAAVWHGCRSRPSPEFKLMPEIMDQAREQARKYGTGFEVVEDMDEAFRDADIVYPKSWGPLVYTTDMAESAKIIDKYKDWITDDRRMGLAKEDCIFMHPLPADRNIEVTRFGDRRSQLGGL